MQVTRGLEGLGTILELPRRLTGITLLSALNGWSGWAWDVDSSFVSVLLLFTFGFRLLSCATSTSGFLAFLSRLLYTFICAFGYYCYLLSLVHAITTLLYHYCLLSLLFAITTFSYYYSLLLLLSLSLSPPVLPRLCYFVPLVTTIAIFPFQPVSPGLGWVVGMGLGHSFLALLILLPFYLLFAFTFFFLSLLSISFLLSSFLLGVRRPAFGFCCFGL